MVRRRSRTGLRLHDHIIVGKDGAWELHQGIADSYEAPFACAQCRCYERPRKSRSDCEMTRIGAVTRQEVLLRN
jgi:hypothetical protein